MRHLAPSDLSTAARALLAAAPAERIDLSRRMCREARAADSYRKRFGRSHPAWGNGSLEGAARGYPLAEPRHLGDREYLICLSYALDAVIRHLGDHRLEDAA